MGHHGSNLFTHLPSPPLSLPPFLSPLFLLSCPPPPSVISTRSSRGHPPPINVTPPPPPPPGAHRTRNNSPFVASPKRSIRYCQHLRPGSSALLHGGFKCAPSDATAKYFGVEKLYRCRHSNFDHSGNSSLLNKVQNMKYTTKGNSISFVHSTTQLRFVKLSLQKFIIRDTKRPSTPHHPCMGSYEL